VTTRKPRIVRVEPFGRGGAKARVHLDEGEIFEVMLEALERCRVGVGDGLSDRRRKALLAADADVRVREAALNLISFRSRTRSELARKLRAKGFEVARIAACLDRLAESGLIDDAAVSAAFVRDRLRHRPRGRSRLRSELRAKGVTSDVADDVVDGVFEEEGVTDIQLATEVAEGWVSRQSTALVAALALDSWTDERRRAQRRLRGYLARRGFSGEALRSGVARAEALAAERREG
jgi:regulatory protein